MAFEQDYDAPKTTIGVERNLSRNKKQNSTSESITEVMENLNGCFDCNICLDTCNDPVVTLCGHLYCWPCIYKWLRVRNPSSESSEKPKCPVCKAQISSSSLVPLYGRGTSLCDSKVEKSKKALEIPHRPKAPGINTTAYLASAASMSTDLDQQFHHPFNNYPSTTSIYSPMIHMVGEMVFARIFGSSETNLFAYPYSNSYSRGNGSPRLRRQEMLLDNSLNRLSIFLFCCIALCLILF